MNGAIFLRWALGLAVGAIAGLTAAAVVPPFGYLAIMMTVFLPLSIWVPWLLAAVPVFIYLARRNYKGTAFGMAGAVLGLLNITMFMLTGGFDLSHHSGHGTVSLSLLFSVVASAYPPAAVVGFVTGYVFWLIAIRPRSNSISWIDRDHLQGFDISDRDELTR